MDACTHKTQRRISRIFCGNDYADLAIYGCADCGAEIIDKEPRTTVAADESPKTHDAAKMCATLAKYADALATPESNAASISMRQIVAATIRLYLREAHAAGHPRLFARTYRMWR